MKLLSTALMFAMANIAHTDICASTPRSSVGYSIGYELPRKRKAEKRERIAKQKRRNAARVQVAHASHKTSNKKGRP